MSFIQLFQLGVAMASWQWARSRDLAQVVRNVTAGAGCNQLSCFTTLELLKVSNRSGTSARVPASQNGKGVGPGRR